MEADTRAAVDIPGAVAIRGVEAAILAAGGQRRQQEAPRPDGRKTLQRIADETGGRLFEVNKKDTIAGIYKEIRDELQAQYRLEFVPDKDTAAEGYHRIVLTPKPKDLYLQTRDGYFGRE